jgi:hypothetical protein
MQQSAHCGYRRSVHEKGRLAEGKLTGARVDYAMSILCFVLSSLLATLPLLLSAISLNYRNDEAYENPLEEATGSRAHLCVLMSASITPHTKKEITLTIKTSSLHSLSQSVINSVQSLSWTRYS